MDDIKSKLDEYMKINDQRDPHYIVIHKYSLKAT